MNNRSQILSVIGLHTGGILWTTMLRVKRNFVGIEMFLAHYGLEKD
ncbi:MAG: hypothetical protein ABR556_06760 [Pyrinomonadaceae bacterium]